MNEIASWMTGVNRNVEGKQKARIMRYSGGHPAYREHCDAVAARPGLSGRRRVGVCALDRDSDPDRSVPAYLKRTLPRIAI
jgi:hypothetical protein